MKNPNVCRKIMYALIFSGLIIANGSALSYSEQIPCHPDSSWVDL